MFTLTITTGNAAFDDTGAELARILRKLADRLETEVTNRGHADEGGLMDFNGNTVGSWSLTADIGADE